MTLLKKNIEICYADTKAGRYNKLMTYASMMWDNSAKCNVNKIELVQWNTARFTSCNYRSPIYR